MSRARFWDGTVRHRRFAPLERTFRYGLYMTLLDLDDVEASLAGSRLASARRPSPIRFRRRDYLDGVADADLPLAEAVRRLVTERTGRRPGGPVRLLTHLRTWGVSFNPVSFYYCYGESGQGATPELAAIVVEITNTPWDERHVYVLEASEADRVGDAWRWRLDKEFHVSPFLPMEMAYRWTFTDPAAADERLLVHMENRPSDATRPGRDDGPKIFDATLELRRGPRLATAGLLWRLFRYPVMPALVLYRIYRQASEIFLRRVPFHPHPAS